MNSSATYDSGMGEFIQVHRQHRRRKKCKQRNGDELYASFSKESIQKKVFGTRDSILESSYYSTFIKLLESAMAESGINSIPEILCYGLGCFSESLCARYQCGFLFALKNHFNSEVFIYDPLFSNAESEFLNYSNFNLISQNEEAKRQISRITLVYLPHCPKQLTNNFLWANWGIKLANSVIVGNSFEQTIFADYSSNPSKQTLKYMQLIGSHVSEYKVPNTFNHMDVFNDTSIHIFPMSKLLKLDYSFWNPSEPPEYKAGVEFIAK